MSIESCSIDELIKICKKRGLEVKMTENINSFSVIIRYDRGLGSEFKILDRVVADTPQQAQEKANISANEWAAANPDVEIKQVKIKP